jgi:hypothetical protein|tara:strand:+ start:296 stop:571 length:276 start_codon:yes stop_codon:yes gene_type:complete
MSKQIDSESNLVHLKNAIDDLYQDAFYNDVDPYVAEVVHIDLAIERLKTIKILIEKRLAHIEKTATQVEYERRMEEDIISLYQTGDNKFAK